MKDIISRYFTNHLKNSLESAQEIVQKRKGASKKVEIIDILKAIAHEEGSIAFNLLRNVKALKSDKTIKSRIRKTGKNIYKAGSIELASDKNFSGKPVPFSIKAYKVIVGAIRCAQQFQFPYVGTEHILFSILETNDKPLNKILEAERVEFVKIFEQTKKILLKTGNFGDDPISLIKNNKSLFYPNNQVGKTISGSEPINEEEKQEFLQEVLGEVSDLFSSFLEKKAHANESNSQMDFRQPLRPTFGLISPQNTKTDQFIEYFAHDLNKDIVDGKVDPVIGRNKEVDSIVRVLMRKSKNNPVLIGEPGVGKTAIVTGLASRIVQRDVPQNLIGKKVLSLDLGLLVAGTSFRGEFEDRFKRVIEEAESNPNIILFIDELHNIIGAGSAQGSLDAANIMKPALARGKIRCIGATTIEEYYRHIEKDGALERRFQPIQVRETSLKETEGILFGIKKHYEDFHNVKIADSAIKKSVYLAHRFINDRYFPDKAIDLLDETAAYVVQDEHQKGSVKKLQKLESQKEKLTKIKEQMIKTNNLELADSLIKSEKELDIIMQRVRKKVLSERKFIPVVDDKDVVAVVSKMLSLPNELLLEDPSERIKNLPYVLKKLVKGQDKAIDKIISTLERSLAGISDPDRPGMAFLFIGPTGVGKTYLSKILSRKLFLKKDALIRVDMSEFGEKHTVSKLLGSPPGYVGYGEKNSFTDLVRKNPYSVVLFDEIEKAHPDIFHILLQVLEDGFLTDSMGRKINFKNSLIIFTSNLGNNELLRGIIGFGKNEVDINKIEKSARRKKVEEFLKPEFINRLTGTVFFRPLNKEDVAAISKIEVSKLVKRIKKSRGILLEIDPRVYPWLAKKSISKKHGVRLLRRLIQQKIEEPIAHNIIAGKIEKNSTVSLKLIKKREKTLFKFQILRPKPPKLFKQENSHCNSLCQKNKKKSLVASQN